MRRLRTILSLAGALTILAAAAQAEITVEGSVGAMSVTAENAERSAVVAAIVERFGLHTDGSVIGGDPVSGKFDGSLSAVLKSILSANGYAIAYKDGNPIRVSFPEHGSPIEPPQPATDDFSAAIAKQDVKPPPQKSDPASASMQRIISQQFSQRQAEAGVARPSEPDASKADGSKQLLDMTRKAIEELKAMEKRIKATRLQI